MGKVLVEVLIKEFENKLVPIWTYKQLKLGNCIVNYKNIMKLKLSNKTFYKNHLSNLTRYTTLKFSPFCW